MRCFYFLFDLRALGLTFALSFHIISLFAQTSPYFSHGAWNRSDLDRPEIKLIFTGHEFAEGYDIVKTALDKHGLKASFFLTGDFYRNPEFQPLIQELHQEGHYLGAHSDKHLLYCSWANRDSLLIHKDSFLIDLQANYEEMSRFGISPAEAPCFLPPYEWYNDSIAAWTHAAGLQLVNFSPGTSANQDWSYPAKGIRYYSSDTLIERILAFEEKQDHGLNGFHLLLHMGVDPRRPDPLYHQLDSLLSHLKKSGYAFSTFAPVSDKEARVKLALERLQGWYNDSTGLWASTSWWNAANALTSIIRYVQLSGDHTYKDFIYQSHSKTRRFLVTDSPDRPAWTCEHYLNDYYDDEGWWGLAWCDAYETLEDSVFLDEARIIFSDIASGWDSVCGGGTYWKKPNIGKGSISNGLFMLLGLRLAQLAPEDKIEGQTYQEWASASWRWFQQNKLISSDSLVYNGLAYKTDCAPGGTYWTYNQGVMIGALTEWYHLTGESSYLDHARRIVYSVMEKLTDEEGILLEPSKGSMNGDQSQFKGVFMRHLATWNKEVKDPRIATFIHKQAESLWKNARNPAKQELGGRWAGPFDQADAARQSSGLEAFLADWMSQP